MFGLCKKLQNLNREMVFAPSLSFVSYFVYLLCSPCTECSSVAFCFIGDLTCIGAGRAFANVMHASVLVSYSVFLSHISPLQRSMMARVGDECVRNGFAARTPGLVRLS